MTRLIDRKSLTLILLLAGVFLFAATQVSEGFFIIDELIYFIGAEAFWKTSSFAVQNGFDRFGSDNLRIWLLSEGPIGLTPQYPVGLTLAAYPLMEALGQKTLIFLNVCAGIGTLFVTHALARRLFGSQQVAYGALILLALCSFWPEFVLAHWPHSLSIFFTSSAIYFFLVACDCDARTRQIIGIALLSGVAVGLGMFFRLEAVLLLPAFGAIAILYAPKPVAVLLGGLLGLLPVLALMALFNEARFGTLNPLSYGSVGGGTVATRHLVPAAAMLVALIGLIIYRVNGGFGKRTRRLSIVAGLLCLGALLLSPYASILTRLMQGIEALLINATVIVDPRLGVQQQADGTLLFWGLPKKALGQSLPWLGCLALLAGAAYHQHKRSIVMIVIFFVLWSLPFLLLSWHGGLGSNMRYFLPTLPLLAILAAALLCKLAETAAIPLLRLPLATAALGFACAAFWSITLSDRSAQLHQFVSLGLLCAVTAICLIATRIPSQRTAKPALLMVSLALGLSAFLGLDDLKAGQERRSKMAQLSAGVATISGPVVIYAPPEAASHAFNNTDQLVALPHPFTNQVDVGFVEEACAAEYNILVLAGMTPEFVREGYEFSDRFLSLGAGRLLLAQLNCTR